MKEIKLKCDATIEWFPEYRAFATHKEGDTFRVLVHDPNDDFFVGRDRETALLSYDGSAARGSYATFFVRRNAIPGMIRALSRLYRTHRPPKE